MHDIYAFSDIHGMWDLYRAIMDYCHEQDEDAMIIFCGDACDRGPAGYQIMKELLDNPKVVYLKGNHEDMFCKAAREIKENFSFDGVDRERVRHILNTCMVFDYRYPEIQNALGNGGIDTLTDWVMDGKPLDIVERLEALPYTFSTDTCDFCHAAGVYKVFERVSDAEYNGFPIDPYDANSIIWSRGAFNYTWAQNRTCIFGHTPVPYLLEDLKIKRTEENIVRPYKYIGTFGNTNGTKIDMDTGAAFLKYAWVLNCLTMKAQGFRLENDIVKKIECIQM